MKLPPAYITIPAICVVVFIVFVGFLGYALIRDAQPSPGSTVISGSGGNAEIKIVEVEGHRFAVIVGFEMCAICEVTGESKVEKP